MSSYAAAPQAYRESSVLTAPPAQLVVTLYDGARRFLHQASVAMAEHDVELCNQRLQRAEAILNELLGTLDMSAGEVAEQLQSIYLFCLRELLESRIEQDAGRIETVSKLLGELRGSWAQIAAAAA